MKKIILLAAILAVNSLAFGQILPSFQLGIKAGANMSKLTTEQPLSSDNRTGYYGGLWARIGAAGIHLQPEAYVSGKNTTVKRTADGAENNIEFTSLDVPVLIGTKFGAAGLGLRLNTGPVVSFIFKENETPKGAVNSAFSGNFKDQNFGWQFGAGLDISKIGIDLRYETGLSKLGEATYENAKLGLFTFGVALRLF